MPEKKLTASVGERMTKETLDIKSTWTNPDYAEYQEVLQQLIRRKIEETTPPAYTDNTSDEEKKFIAALSLGMFIKSLPVAIIGYFHKEGAFSSSKDTRRMDWIIKKWGEAGFSMGYDLDEKEPWVSVSSEDVETEKWTDLRGFIDDHMARELN